MRRHTVAHRLMQGGKETLPELRLEASSIQLLWPKARHVGPNRTGSSVFPGGQNLKRTSDHAEWPIFSCLQALQGGVI